MEVNQEKADLNSSVSMKMNGTLDSLVIVSALLSLLTVLINLLVGILLFWSRANYTISFLLSIGNFTIANFFYGCIGLPIQAQLLSTGNRWNYSYSSCLSIMTLTDIFEDVSTLSLILVNLDQAVSLARPNWYKTSQFKKVMLAFSAVSWAFPTAVELYLHVNDWYRMGHAFIHLSDICVSIVSKYLKIYGFAFTTCLCFPIFIFFIYLQYIKLSKIHIMSLYGFDKLMDMITFILMIDITVITTRLFSGTLIVACLIFGASSKFLSENAFPTLLYIFALWSKRASFGVPMLLLLLSKTIRNSVKQLIHGDRTYIVPSNSDSQMDDINMD